jgi:hypothetical protein
MFQAMAGTAAGVSDAAGAGWVTDWLDVGVRVVGCDGEAVGDVTARRHPWTEGGDGVLRHQYERTRCRTGLPRHVRSGWCRRHGKLRLPTSQVWRTVRYH